MKITLHHLAIPIIVLSIAGCDRNPYVEIVGSYFPGWLISLAFGVLLSFGTHALLRKQGLSYTIGPPAIVYPGMVILFTCLLWLCFFA